MLSGALFDRPAFRNVICHGVVLDDEGRKLSKKLRNYPDPEEVFESHGSDALRWYLMCSPILRGGDLRIATDGSDITEVIRLVLNPIWNAYTFFTLYANADGYTARLRTDADGLLDRYMLAKTRALVEAVHRAHGRLRHRRRVRRGAVRSSTRSTTGTSAAAASASGRRAPTPTALPISDKADAYDTLYTVLTTLSRGWSLRCCRWSPRRSTSGLCGRRARRHRLGPPRGLARHGRAAPGPGPRRRRWTAIREVCSAALGLREDHRLRTRLPLQRADRRRRATPSGLDGLTHLIRDEVNVKEVVLTDDLAVGRAVRPATQRQGARPPARQGRPGR